MTEIQNYTNTFVTGEQVTIKLLVEVNGKLVPIITNWDTAEITTRFIQKKNKGIGMAFTRNHNLIEDYEISLSRAKQDSALESLIIAAQRNQQGRIYHNEFVIEIEINHYYFPSAQQPPSDEFDEFTQFIQKAGKSIIANATRQATAELRSIATQQLNNASKTAANFIQTNSKPFIDNANQSINKLKRILPQANNLQRFGINTLAPVINSAQQKIESKTKNLINSAINLPQVLGSFGVTQPDTFKEQYSYIFAVINDKKTAHQPKDISKETIVFNASKELVKSEKDLIANYTHVATLKALTTSQINQRYVQSLNYDNSITTVETKSQITNEDGSTIIFVEQENLHEHVRIKTNQDVAKQIGNVNTGSFDSDFAETKRLMNQIFDYTVVNSGIK